MKLELIHGKLSSSDNYAINVIVDGKCALVDSNILRYNSSKEIEKFLYELQTAIINLITPNLINPIKNINDYAQQCAKTDTEQVLKDLLGIK